MSSRNLDHLSLPRAVELELDDDLVRELQLRPLPLDIEERLARSRSKRVDDVLPDGLMRRAARRRRRLVFRRRLFVVRSALVSSFPWPAGLFAVVASVTRRFERSCATIEFLRDARVVHSTLK